MTDVTDSPGVIVRAGDAERLSFPAQSIQLFAEGGATGGAFSALRATLHPGASGALPHHHSEASELFFIIAGSLDILVGDRVVTANAGDIAVVRPMAMHAFANGSASEPADVLIVFGPGIERFDYFRLLQDIVAGKKTFADVLAAQERFDNWFSESAAWTAHLANKRQP